MASTSAHVVTAPDARTPLGLDRWIETAGILQRFPEIQNVGFDELVPASQLAAFQARPAREPAAPVRLARPPGLGTGRAPERKREVLLPGGGGNGARSRGIRPAGPELLRARADHDVRPRCRRGQLRARHDRRQNLTRGRDPRLPDRSAPAARWRPGGVRSSAGSGSFSSPTWSSNEPSKGTPTSP